MLGNLHRDVMERTFEIIDHTADVGIIAYGDTIEQLFSHAAVALFSLITELESIRENLQHNLKITSHDNDSLLVEWLNELIYLFDAEQMVFHRFEIESLKHNQLKAVCYGEKFDASRHRIKIGVKAATYYMLKIEEDNQGYRARVILDI